MDVSRYLARVGYAGSRALSLATLNAIVSRHVQAIPFENLDVLLGQPISIDVEAVEDKLVRRQRGGYCFEHNTLLLHVLGELGFSAKALSARSRYMQLERTQLPRTHMFLRVDWGSEPYLVDAGFGGFSPPAALRIELETRQETSHEPRRIVAEGRWQELGLRAPDAVLVHQVYFADAWHDLYEFTLEEMPLADRVMGNWYTSAHPSSHFRRELRVARATREGRVTLLDRELTRRSAGGVEKRTVASQSELRWILAEDFGLSIPKETRFPNPGLADLPRD